MAKQNDIFSPLPFFGEKKGIIFFFLLRKVASPLCSRSAEVQFALYSASACDAAPPAGEPLHDSSPRRSFLSSLTSLFRV